MKRTHINVALVLVLSGLGAAIWFAQQEAPAGPPLTDLKQEDVTRIAIAHPGQPNIVMEKHAEQWHLMEPVQALADKYEVNGVLALADLELASSFDSGVAKSELGLDPPTYTVTLNDTRIDLGGTEPIAFRRYVATSDKLGVIADPPSAALDADYSDLISKRIVPEDRELTKITLPALTLEKSSEGHWQSADAEHAKASQLAGLAESWMQAKAMWNAAETEDVEGAAEDVTLTLDNGDTIHLKVQAKDPQLILSRKDLKVRYTLSKALAEELLSLRDEDTKKDKSLSSPPE